MVDPFNNVPEDKRTSKAYLEEWVLFGICVCNKPAAVTVKKVDRVLTLLRESVNASPNLTPFELIHRITREELERILRLEKVGQYKRIVQAFLEASTLRVDDLTVDMLESVTGIGPKTARMIMLYYKPESRVAPLDTHVLKYLGSLGHVVPKGTPGKGENYQRLENAFLSEADKLGMTAKELDTLVWQSYTKGENLFAPVSSPSSVEC